MNQKYHPSPVADKFLKSCHFFFFFASSHLPLFLKLQSLYLPHAQKWQRWKAYSKPRGLHLNLTWKCCCWPRIEDGDSCSDAWKKAVSKETKEEGRADGPCQNILSQFWCHIQVTLSLNSICTVSCHVSTDLSGWLTSINQRCEHPNLPFEHFELKITNIIIK